MKINCKLLLSTAISTAFLIAPVTAKANLGSSLTSSSYSDNTYSIQTILAKIGYVPPSQVNGYMDTTTRNAIASFQQANGLAANGLIDPKTAELLNNAFIAAPTQAAPVPQQMPQFSSAPAPEEAAVYSSNSLAIQQILYRLGYLQATPNGYMDAQTRSAIIQFQNQAGLAPNGEIDEATATALNNAYAAGSIYQANGVPRSPKQPYYNSESTFIKDKWLWAAGGAGVLAGGAAAFAGGGGSKGSSAITFNIPSNDSGNQSYDGTSPSSGFNNPASGTAANFLLGDAANSESLSILKGNFSQARGYDGRVYNRNAAGVLLNTTFDSYSIVAVVDSGIDFTHEDLDANVLISDSVTCAAGTCVAGGLDTVSGGHGTKVAGIIAAEDNSVGTVGMAPQAKLLSVKNDLTSLSLTAGFRYINTKGVDVINNSYGSDVSIAPYTQGTQIATATPSELRTQLTQNLGGTNWLNQIQTAVANHTLLVWAAGNESSDQPSYESAMPYYFNGTVNAANLEGYDWSKNWVTVVSVNDSSTISSFSNECGVAKNFCLAAPGEVYTTTFGGTYDTNAVGTSFAAPNVSGALAALLGAYPHLTPEKVLKILFETATDIGTAGTDDVYGRGLVNMDAATNPSGNASDWTIALSSASTSSFTSTGLNLSSAFGDAMTKNNQKIMFTDIFDKDYQVSLSTLARATKDSKSNDERLFEFGSGSFATEAEFGEGSQLAFSLRQNQEGNLRNSLTDDQKHDQNKFLLNQNFVTGNKNESPILNATLGYNVNAADMLGYASLAESNKDHLQISSSFKNPYLNLTEYANGASAGYQYANFGVRVAGYEAQDQQEYQFSDGNKTSGNLAEVYYSNDDNLSVGLQFGSTHETNTFLGSEAGGALDLNAESPTYFTGIAASYSPFKDFSIKANYNSGVTKLSTSGNSLISNVSDVESDSFALGLEFNNVHSSEDKFGISFSQPLRIRSASAYASLPEDIAADGTILYQDAKLDLSPVGRETDLEAYYNMPISDTAKLSLGSMLRMEPNHVQDAPNEGLFLMKYKTEF